MRLQSCLLALCSVALVGAPSFAKKKEKREKQEQPPAAAPVAADPNALNSLTVACSTTNADVFVDGEKIGQAPIELPVPVKNGNHTIRVAKLGFSPFIDTFKATPGKPVQLTVELIPVSGVIHVRSELPNSRVLVDGKYVGDAPADVEADVGPRAVQVTKACYSDYFQNVMSVAGQEVTVEAKLSELPPATNPCIVKALPPPKWYQKKWVWGVIGGGAAVLAGAAVVIAILAQPSGPSVDVSYTVNGLRSLPGFHF